MWNATLGKLKRRFLRGGRAGRRPSYRTTRPLSLEVLEDRTVLATLQPISAANLTLPASDTAGGVSQPKSSQDGRFIVYTSDAPNLVTGQVNTASQTNIFLYDQQQNTTTLVSHVPGSNNTTVNAPSAYPRISGDGRFVAYASFATNLVPGQAGPRGAGNVFLWDRLQNSTELVSHDATSATTSGNDSSFTQGTSGFGFTRNTGRYLLFNSYASNLVVNQSGPTRVNLFLRDTLLDTTTLVSHNAFDSTRGGENDVLFSSDISADGGFVTFTSIARDVVSGQQGPGANVFLHEVASGSNRLVSGAFDPFFGVNSTFFGAGLATSSVISANGRFITYISSAPNLVAFQTMSAPFPTFNVFSYDRINNATILVSGAVTPFGPSPSVTADGSSFVAVVSADGSNIAFVSDAANLFPGQGFSRRNVFLVNPFAHTLKLVTHVAGGPFAAGGTLLSNDTDFSDVSISEDGRFVTYQSTAGNLVFGQPGPFGPRNVFVYDQPSDTNALISRANTTVPVAGDADSTAARISLDGSSIAFLSFANNLNPGVTRAAAGTDLFVFRQFATGPLVVSSRSAFRANASSFAYGTSFDGRYVVFTSNATNVVPGQVEGNSDQDVFLLDRATSITTLVSHTPGSFASTGNAGSPDTSGGRQAPGSPAVISQDGNWIAFVSRASNLVAGQSTPDLVDPRGDNIFLYSRQTGEVRLVSHSFQSTTLIGDGPSFDPAISADGRFITFVSFAKSLVPGLTGQQGDFFKANVFIYDRDNPSQIAVLSSTGLSTTTGDGNSAAPSISDDGRYVVFQSYATNLLTSGPVNPTSNIYLVDRLTGTTTQVSQTVGGGSPNASSFSPAISPDGNFVTFLSFATDLVPGQRDTGFTNIFLYDRRNGGVRLVSGVNGSTSFSASGFSDSPVISKDGRYVAFRSDAGDVLGAGQNGPAGSNIFLFDNSTGQVKLASHAAGAPTTTASGDSTAPAIDEAGLIVSYLSTATNLVPGQTGGGVNNVFGWVQSRDANFLASGVNGSATAAAADPSFLPVISRDPIVVFSVAGTLIPGTGGTNNSYANTIVDIAFTPATLTNGSQVGALAGTLSTTTVLIGQVILSQFSLPAGGAGDNNKFAAGTTAANGTAPLTTQFVVNTAVQSGFNILIQADTGLGIVLRAFTLTATTQSTPLTLTINQAAGQLDPTSATTINFTVVFNRAVNNFATGDVVLGGNAGATTAIVSGSGTTYNVAVSGMTASGTVTASIPDNRATDAGGMPNSASTSTDNNVSFSLVTQTAQQAYVTQLYRSILNRGPEPAGLNTWVTRLNNGVSRTTVTRAIWESEEHRGLQVDVYYTTYLGRAADPGGRLNWVNQLKAGRTEEQVIRSFLLSGEYRQRHPGTDGFIRGIYMDLLGRDADPGGLAHWRNVLAGPSGDVNVVQGIQASAEQYRRVVNRYYVDYLRRTGEAAGVNSWVGELLAPRITEGQVAQAFLASNEFFNNAGR